MCLGMSSQQPQLTFSESLPSSFCMSFADSWPQTIITSRRTGTGRTEDQQRHPISLAVALHERLVEDTFPRIALNCEMMRKLAAERREIYWCFLFLLLAWDIRLERIIFNKYDRTTNWIIIGDSKFTFSRASCWKFKSMELWMLMPLN